MNNTPKSFKLSDIERIKCKLQSIHDSADDAIKSASIAKQFYMEKQIGILITISWASVSGILVFRPSFLLILAGIVFSLSLLCTFWGFFLYRKLYSIDERYQNSLKNLASKNVVLSEQFLSSEITMYEYTDRVLENMKDWNTEYPESESELDTEKNTLLSYSMYLWSAGIVLVISYFISILFAIN